jgi:hypothetical protein
MPPFQELSMKMHATLGAAVLLTLSGLAAAQAPADPTATPRIDQREARQQQRIAQGAASGQLTPRETYRLEKREAKINADEAAAKSDGKVTRAERTHLRHEENRTSRAIYRQKHDGQRMHKTP